MNDTFKNFSLMAGGSHYPAINPAVQQQFGEAIVRHILKRLEEQANLAFEQQQRHTWATLEALVIEVLDDFDMKAVQ
jgi:hypothetical protein